MIGLFGGHREGNETFLECVVREIYEEISYFLPSERFAHLIRYTGAHPLGGAFHCEIYVANNVAVDQLLITEGWLLPVKPEDVATIDARFSPLGTLCSEHFLERPRKHAKPFAALGLATARKGENDPLPVHRQLLS
jgi:8-oxo-dGTP diphosphatase